MITVKNIKVYENMDFEDYKLLPGTSFSMIKSDFKEIKVTNKMNLGSQVDCYINNSNNFSGDLRIIKPLAYALKLRVGDLYNKFKKQISVTCDFVYEGMILNYKGRPDWALENLLIVDTKVSDSIDKTIHFFGYPNQISGYCLPFNANKGLILAANPKNNTVKLINIPIKFDWWERQILKYGKPL